MSLGAAALKSKESSVKVGDLVQRKMYPGEVGLFMGLRTFGSTALNGDDYTCAEVMWFGKSAPNGDAISTVQHDLLEVISESR